MTNRILRRRGASAPATATATAVAALSSLVLCGSAAAAPCGPTWGDLTFDGAVNAVDVQCEIIVVYHAMGAGEMPDCMAADMYEADMNCNAAMPADVEIGPDFTPTLQGMTGINVTDIAYVIAAALDEPIPLEVDADADGCPDACDSPCGDGVCTALQGENCSTCPMDCLASGCAPPPPTGGTGCEAAPTNPLYCGTIIADTTVGGTSVFDDYSCTSWDESGPEMVYEFVAPADGWVWYGLESDADLDVFFLEGQCSASSCVHHGNTDGDFSVEAGTTYFMVVDGYNGGSSDFELQFDCMMGCDPALLCQEGACGDLACSDGTVHCGECDPGLVCGPSNQCEVCIGPDCPAMDESVCEDGTVCDDGLAHTDDICLPGGTCSHPPNGDPVCELVGAAGEEVSCTLRMARFDEAGAAPTAAQFTLQWDPNALSPIGFFDESILAPGVPAMTVEVPPALLYPSGHTLTIPQAVSEAASEGTLNVLLAHFSDPSSPISDAYVTGGTEAPISGGFVEFRVTLTEAHPAEAPARVYATALGAATADVTTLAGFVYDETMVFWNGCGSEAPCDDLDDTTVDTCAPFAPGADANGCVSTIPLAPETPVCETGYTLCELSEVIDWPGPSPAAGMYAICPVRAAVDPAVCADPSCAPSAFQAHVEYDSDALSLVDFYDELCLDGAGCFPVPVSGLTAAMAQPLSTGHTLSTLPNTAAAWDNDGGGVFLTIHLGDPTTPLTSATLQDGAIEGESTLFELYFAVNGELDPEDPAAVCVDDVLFTTGSSLALPFDLGPDRTLITGAP